MITYRGIEIRGAAGIYWPIIKGARYGPFMHMADAERFIDVTKRLGDYYLTTEEIRAWLYAPHPQLKDKSAMELLRAGRSSDVLAVLDRLDASVYL